VNGSICGVEGSSCRACMHEETRERISGHPRRIVCGVADVTLRYGADDRYCSNADKDGS